MYSLTSLCVSKATFASTLSLVASLCSSLMYMYLLLILDIFMKKGEGGDRTYYMACSCVHVGMNCVLVCLWLLGCMSYVNRILKFLNIFRFQSCGSVKTTCIAFGNPPIIAWRSFDDCNPK